MGPGACNQLDVGKLMNYKATVKRFMPSALWRWCIAIYTRIYAHESIDRFTFDASSDIKSDIQEKYGHRGKLLDLFAGNEGVVVHKWHHYIPLYDRYFSPFRGRQIRFLEIGVCKGGSLQMWRKYFGDDAIIFGVDIDPECEKLNGLAGQVRIGSQTDSVFLQSVVKEMGGVDIILDDGSHHMAHIPITLKSLFSHLSDGGIYVIEDLHTAYWKSFGGGYRAKGNFLGCLLDSIDDMHHWYHKKKIRQAAISNECTGIHIHDSMVIFEKGRVFRPVHSKVGHE
jgi:hypothetical protein